MVNVGIDIKDIPKIDDKEFSITLNAFFVVRWTDKRMIIDQHKMKHIFKKGKLKKVPCSKLPDMQHSWHLTRFSSCQVSSDIFRWYFFRCTIS